jgi:type I restriction enzyme S subunit
VLLPPTLAEQEAIASALSDADGLIESLEKLIAKKRQIKHGTMQELLTGQRRLPGFTGKWENYRFDQLFSNIRNASNSRSELSPHGDIAYVHYGDIHIHPTAFLSPVGLQTFISRAKVRSIPRLMDGDLLMADASEDTTAIGKAVEITGLNGAEAVAGLHTMALRGNKEYIAHGFKGYLQYMPKVRNALVSLATGVSVYGITKSGVKAIEVTIPQTAEQSAIAAILSDMDAELAALESKLSKARQVKQGMMQELLTGRTRLV